MTSPNDPGSSPPAPGRRAAVVGLGLIGGSVALALRKRGWHVTGRDADPERSQAAKTAGVVDAVGEDPQAEVTFLCTPVGALAGEARRVLGQPGRRADAAVTDVGGVKASVVGAVDHPRFVGGHPMAGSEQVGLEGADGELFVGATWVLTPTATTELGAYATVQSVVGSLGAEVLSLSPEQHDALVAVVSHVPHLTAATLMDVADRRSEQHGALLRMAAGGFRDMTRVAAGHPGIWPDICAENAPAIVAGLDDLLASLAAVRDSVAGGDSTTVLEVLSRAAEARRSLPARAVRPERLVEVRVPVPDRPGVLAELTATAGDLDVNIFDMEIAHSAEGERGVVVMVVGAEVARAFAAALSARGYRPAWRQLA